jgi:hypothetical protein
MDYFDAFAEVYASIERHVQETGQPPTEIVVSPALYTWLADMVREENLLRGVTMTDPVTLDTPYGPVKIVIDEALSPYDVETH